MGFPSSKILAAAAAGAAGPPAAQHQHIMTMTDSTAVDIAEMECGTSLAEDIWAVVPSFSSTTMPSLAPLRVTNSESAAAAAVSTASASVTVDAAWTKIHQLRSRLAADVISDPSSLSSSLSSTGYNFPTFISPFERPKVNNDNSTIGSSGTTTTTTTPNGSYQGMAIPLIYCDQTASQRPVRSIENYIRNISMPCYANTHTVSCCCCWGFCCYCFLH